MQQARQERTIFPAWKNAVEIVAENFKSGDVLSMNWIHENFMIEKPNNGTFDDFQKYQFELMAAMDGFKNELLEVHQIAIANIRGEGYRILHPKEQTGYSEKKFIDDMKKSATKAVALLNNIKFDSLSDVERKENADTKSRVAAIYTMSKKKKAIT